MSGIVASVADGSADEIQRLKFKRLQAEAKIMKARGAIVSAEIEIRVIDHCIQALSPQNKKLP